MALPGLLIEYLISGVIALVWLGPLLRSTGLDLAQPLVAGILVASLYPVGMVIDYLAYWLVRPVKPLVRKRALAKYAGSGQEAAGDSVERQIRISLFAPELAKEIAMRSSRDRIARGAVVNVLVAIVLEHVFRVYPPMASLAIWIPVFVLSAAIWWAFESVSFGYELRAERVLREKLASKGLGDE